MADLMGDLMGISQSSVLAEGNENSQPLGPADDRQDDGGEGVGQAAAEIEFCGAWDNPAPANASQDSQAEATFEQIDEKVQSTERPGGFESVLKEAVGKVQEEFEIQCHTSVNFFETALLHLVGDTRQQVADWNGNLQNVEASNSEQQKELSEELAQAKRRFALKTQNVA
jgi:hypothetical protein